MVVGAVRPGCRRRPCHHLVLRAQGRFQGASQGLFLVKSSLSVWANSLAGRAGYTGVCVILCVCVCFKCI